MTESIDRMMLEITKKLNQQVYSIWLYGSIVLNDFRFGWSDIDFIVFANHPISEMQAEQLVMLRQSLSNEFPENPFFPCFEGAIIFAVPSREELVLAVQNHFDSIRKYAVQTNESLYSCGWLLDIARCIYTLRYNDIIGKTQAGIWALSEHIFPEEEPLRKTLEIRQQPIKYKDRADIKLWLSNLGTTVQRYADILGIELNHNK